MALKIVIVQKNKINDAEKIQEIERLLIQSYKSYKESERQMKISVELGEKAINLILSEDVFIDEILERIKKYVEKEEKI